MDFSTRLTYKPKMNTETSDLIEKGALVSMLEFYLEENGNKLKTSHLENLGNAFTGKNSGPYTVYRSSVQFDEEKKVFQALPCSTIKTGYPFKLFTAQSNIGLLIDPEKVTFSYIVGMDAMSIVAGDNLIKFVSLNKTTTELNFSNDCHLPIKHGNEITVPVYRSAEAQTKLRKFFDQQLFKIYNGGADPQEKNFMANFKNAADNGFAPMNEIGINAPAEAIKGIVLYSGQGVNRSSDYSTKNLDWLDGMAKSYLVKEVIKNKSGINLPIIHYANGGIDRTPEIKEINVETKKIARILKTNLLAKKLYNHLLGPEQTRNIMLGKSFESNYLE